MIKEEEEEKEGWLWIGLEQGLVSRHLALRCNRSTFSCYLFLLTVYHFRYDGTPGDVLEYAESEVRLLTVSPRSEIYPSDAAEGY